MKQKIDIDEVDRRLLQLLQQDASRSNQDLALAGVAREQHLERREQDHERRRVLLAGEIAERPPVRGDDELAHAAAPLVGAGTGLGSGSSWMVPVFAARTAVRMPAAVRCCDWSEYSSCASRLMP